MNYNITQYQKSAHALPRFLLQNKTKETCNIPKHSLKIQRKKIQKKLIQKETTIDGRTEKQSVCGEIITTAFLAELHHVHVCLKLK